MRRATGGPRPLKALTDQDVERVCDAYSRPDPRVEGMHPFVRMRNQLVVRLLFDSGARHGELARVLMDDLDVRARLIVIRATDPGEHEHSVSWGDETHRALLNYLRLRERLQPRDPHLMVGRQGHGISPDTIGRIFARAGALFGLSFPVGRPHRARHTLGRVAALEGVPDRTAAEMLGQKTVVMAQRYGRLFSGERLRAQRAISPVDRAAHLRQVRPDRPAGKPGRSGRAPGRG